MRTTGTICLLFLSFCCGLSASDAASAIRFGFMETSSPLLRGIDPIRWSGRARPSFGRPRIASVQLQVRRRRPTA